MKTWEDKVIPYLYTRASSDTLYQNILQKMLKAEKQYRVILGSLDEESKMILDDYIALCEELQFQLARFAYEYGRYYK